MPTTEPGGSDPSFNPSSTPQDNPQPTTDLFSDIEEVDKDHEQVQPPSIDIEELGIKNKTEQELLDALLSAGAEWTDSERSMVVAAYNLASSLHKDDKHRNLPYTYHLLRNANRVAGYLHITDPEIITAVILHDIVEDHAKSVIRAGQPDLQEAVTKDLFERQQIALETIGALFRPKVADMVAAVTNPPASPEGSTYEERLQLYADKVRQGIQTPEGWIIKFVDWLDNGLGIIYSDEPQGSDKMQHFARKYGMVIPILEERYYQPDIQAMLDPVAKAYVENQFQLGKTRLLGS